MTRIAIIDFTRTACLCDVGLPGGEAAVLVGDDGRADFVIVDVSLLGDEGHTYDPTTPQAPHEQPGALPPRWQARVALAPLRCGRKTKTGRPCRTPVTTPGDACPWHRCTTTSTATERAQ
jgi:hypothetical protein